jgi:hypothetical protein
MVPLSTLFKIENFPNIKNEPENFIEWELSNIKIYTKR